MEKRLARSLWCASSLILLSGLSSAGMPAQLRQEALGQPDTISAWLQANAKTADRRIAQRYQEMGLKAQKKGNWSSASKAFGESALFFPTPTALVGCADNHLRDLGALRTRQKDTSKAKGDLASALALYRSALAADAQLNELTAPALARLKADEACLDTHLKTGAPQSPTCRPVRLYVTASY
jgi:tetratricopeptide (TPR) repeat protein